MVCRHLDGDAALSKQQHRAKHRIGGHADDEFVRMRPPRHRLHREAGQHGVGQQGAQPPLHCIGGSQHRRSVLQVEHDAADI